MLANSISGTDLYRYGYELSLYLPTLFFFILSEIHWPKRESNIIIVKPFGHSNCEVKIWYCDSPISDQISLPSNTGNKK